MNYNNINFGYHSAEDESIQAPELLTQGFYDCGGWTEELLNGRKFVILGNKGVGKSALINRIYIDKAPDKFYSLNNLRDFPFSNFCSKLITGNYDEDTVMPNSWELLILLQIVWLLQKDNSREPNSSFDVLIKLLEKLGISPEEKLERIWSQTLNKKHVFYGPSIDLKPYLGLESTASIFRVEKEFHYVETLPNIEKLISYTRHVIADQNTENSFYVFFDGLDKAIFEGTDSYVSIASLFSQCYKLNMFFKECGLRIKIILACRNDLFNRLPILNANAIRQTYSISLEWFDDKRDFLNSKLCKLINFRAKMSLKEEIEIFTEFFPENLYLAKRVWAAYIFLFFHTRFTPRDLLAVLKSIQQKHNKSRHKVSADEIIMGLTNYSHEYFKNEIIDELYGYLTTTEIAKTFSVLISMKVAHFYTDTFYRGAAEFGISNERALEILHLLFDCSAISNTFIAGDGDKRMMSTLYTPFAKLDASREIIVHRGLWKSFNYV